MGDVAKIAAGRQDGGLCDIPGERCHHPISCSGGGCVKRRPQPPQPEGRPMGAIEVTQAAREAYEVYIRHVNGDATDESAIAKLLAGDWDEVHGVKIAAIARQRDEVELTALRSRVAVLAQASQFLVDRLADAESALADGENYSREYCGHVTPAIARLEIVLQEAALTQEQQP